MNFINCTPHPLTIEGLGTLMPSGVVPRVGVERGDPVVVGGVRVTRQRKGAVEGLPAAVEGVGLIVSGMVLEALGGVRDDVFAPDTGADAVRNEKGHIVSVRGLA